MREIKFRAWDTILKTYDHACDIAIKPNGEIIFDDDMDTYKSSDFILEQFTGLHDCEGKEIYEGDIVEVKCMKKYKTDKYVDTVIFYKNCWMLKENKTYMFDNFSLTGAKIIGNIHEAQE